MHDTIEVSGARDEELPKPPGIFRQFLSRHARLIDIAILAVYALANLILVAGALIFASDQRDATVYEIYRDDILLSSGVTAWPDSLKQLIAALGIAAVIGCGALLLWRRSRPFLAVILVAGMAVLPLGIPLQGIHTAAYFFLYAIPVYDSVRRGWIAFAIMTAATSVAAVLYPSGEIAVREVLTLTLVSAVPNLVAVLIGVNIGNRKRYVAAVVARAQQLVIERDQRAQLAVANERSRISREMHDIVAHSLSVMIALSDGASRAVDRAPAEAADAMRSSAHTGRQALAQMRRALGVLREESGAELLPQPGSSDLPDLIATFSDAGLNIEMAATTHIEDAGLGLAVYRIVQEGLTNALRYAGIGANVSVGVDQDEHGVSVSVRDYGTPAGLPVPPTGQGSGHGLIGLRERVRAFGGTLISEATAGDVTGTGAVTGTGTASGRNTRGWVLLAKLPIRDGAGVEQQNGDARG